MDEPFPMAELVAALTSLKKPTSPGCSRRASGSSVRSQASHRSAASERSGSVSRGRQAAKATRAQTNGGERPAAASASGTEGEEDEVPPAPPPASVGGQQRQPQSHEPARTARLVAAGRARSQRRRSSSSSEPRATHHTSAQDAPPAGPARQGVWYLRPLSQHNGEELRRERNGKANKQARSRQKKWRNQIPVLLGRWPDGRGRQRRVTLWIAALLPLAIEARASSRVYTGGTRQNIKRLGRGTSARTRVFGKERRGEARTALTDLGKRAMPQDEPLKDAACPQPPPLPSFDALSRFLSVFVSPTRLTTTARAAAEKAQFHLPENARTRERFCARFVFKILKCDICKEKLVVESGDAESDTYVLSHGAPQSRTRENCDVHYNDTHVVIRVGTHGDAGVVARTYSGVIKRGSACSCVIKSLLK
ncbi:hypothetical protein HPB48_023877 [Haemaphysalis longicornis]|uniref:Uncharacterized protein n=1 Tax=Haemaphysalis longicornis TaxID=44386 RepID=A0A9J6H5Z7_HAELO|nr:hypothetical protein HPB48_023877 [Haemaphysalis longicornis]